MTRNQEWIQDFEQNQDQTITVMNGSTMETTGSGRVGIKGQSEHRNILDV